MEKGSGLEQLRGLIAAGRSFGIFESLDFVLSSVEDGFGRVRGHARPAAYNPMNIVHGGYAAALLDSACGCAVHSKLAPGQAYTTLELKVAYHKAMTAQTGLVRAEGRVLSFGKRAAFAEAKLLGGDGTLYASATSTLLVMTPR